jgi:hypothetical protein
VPPRIQSWPPSLARLSAVGWPGRAYFFKNGKYLRYTTGTTGVIQHPDAGYPKPIAAHWPQRTSIDAGFVMPDGKAYLFDAGSYVRYSGVPEDPNASAEQYRPDPGYPKEIWSDWKRGWAADLDAAVVWPNGKLYVFKGRSYLRYSLGATVPDPGYPKLIRGNWPRLGESFPNGIDSAVVWSSTKAFFFHGDTYARYTITKEAEGMDAGYPRPLASFSPELATL